MKYKIVMSLMLFASSLTYAQEAKKLKQISLLFMLVRALWLVGNLHKLNILENRHYLIG